MLVEQRRDEILQVLEQKGFVSLQELVDRIGASESTVRRDLEHLDAAGQIRRTRGGAAYVGEHLITFEARTSENLNEKQRIAKAVADLVQPEETVLLDGGTTTLEIAKRLIHKSLQIVTNSLPIANLLVNQPGIELILVGGFLYPKTGVALGPPAVAFLETLRVHKFIFSSGGVTEEGLFNSNGLLVDAERKMIAAASQVILAADHTKFGKLALAHLCPLSAVHQVVADAELSPHWQQVVRAAGPELLLVDG